MNGKILSYINSSSCSMYVGDRGSGKSTLMAMACCDAVKHQLPVYSNYPMLGAFAIPTLELSKKDGSKKIYLDKDWLYSTDLSNSLVLLDEVRTIWNARAFKDWNEQDEEFFNFIRKNNTSVIMATQRYDGVDLNIRCAIDMTFFIQRTRFFKNLSSIDISRACQVKIADRNTEIVSRGYSKGARKVVWDVAEMPLCHTFFYRKPFYGKFDTFFTLDKKIIRDPVPWDHLIPQEVQI